MIRPPQIETPNGDLSPSALESIIDPEPDISRPAELIEWGRFDDPCGRLHPAATRQRSLPTAT